MQSNILVGDKAADQTTSLSINHLFAQLNSVTRSSLSMFNVIRDPVWKAWCATKNICIESALFSLPTCYYGIGLRARPGALIVTDSEMIHHSYSSRETSWAAFEPSLRLSFVLSDLASVDRYPLSIWRRILMVDPDGCFRVVTSDNSVHYLCLQQRGDEFAAILDRLGVGGERHHPP